ncbi:MAG: hypothetical protein LAP87_02685 [Acidobacteriia bacterium]|nr:hypothetical protein [Terriglobia bacterium]
MDTRSKILASPPQPWPAFAAPLAVVTGYFDLLRAWHVREFAGVRQRTGARSLLVVVLPLAGEVLPQRARAELVAALRMVDYVVTIDHGELEELVAALQPAALVRLEAADARQARQLMEHVHRRQTR